MRTKIALVSGGGGGIGAETCRQLAGNDDLKEIVIIQRSPPDEKQVAELKGMGVEVSFLPLDLSMLEEIGQFAQQVKQRYPAIHYLVLTAGVCQRRDHHMSVENADFIQLLVEYSNVNGLGPLTLIHELAPALIAGSAGIVVVSSLAAAIGGVVTFVGYDAGKGALEAGVRHYSRHCFDPADPTGNRFHIVTVAPGPVATEMLLTMPPDKVEAFRQSTRTGKLTTPEEVARVIVTALNTPALTGQLIPVNGGVRV